MEDVKEAVPPVDGVDVDESEEAQLIDVDRMDDNEMAPKRQRRKAPGDVSLLTQSFE